MHEWQTYDRFQTSLTRRLLAWAGISLGMGLLMSLRPEKRWKGIGSQFVGWALVNAAIGCFGGRAAEGKRAKVLAGELAAAETAQKETRNLRRLLWVNAGLDVFYILGGLALRRRGRGDEFMDGTGAGIMAQGAALWVFDVVHAVMAESENPL